MNNFFKFSLILFISVCARAQSPTATIVASGATVCTGAAATFTSATSNSPTAYSWTISPTLSVTATPDYSSPFIVFTFGKPGIYTTSLTVSNASGTTTTTKIITVTQSANALFNASLTTTGFPNQLVLTNYSTNTIKNYWIFSDVPGIAGKDSSLNTVKNYTASGSYSVLVIAFGANGCNDTSSYKFFISDSSGVTAPTIFTPNNDNTNDIFRPIARGIKTMNVWIYNRYGTFITSWDKVNGFWDGYTTSGDPCQEGVYFYVIEATGFDGRTYKLKNNLTLIR
ncbi:MAG: gliding motility-associated C-terminal domain-containing protein [Bacteroidetes bacterium]|nr:gliding motility-associated C-terminal domain-containing protein [Bacteroidota bacterium]